MMYACAWGVGVSVCRSVESVVGVWGCLHVCGGVGVGLCVYVFMCASE